MILLALVILVQINMQSSTGIHYSLSKSCLLRLCVYNAARTPCSPSLRAAKVNKRPLQLSLDSEGQISAFTCMMWSWCCDWMCSHTLSSNTNGYPRRDLEGTKKKIPEIWNTRGIVGPGVREWKLYVAVHEQEDAEGGLEATQMQMSLKAFVASANCSL